MKPNLFKKVIFLIFLFSLLMPLFTKAITIESPIQYKTFEELINTIINFIFWVAIAIAPVVIIIAGFYFLTSGGDPEKLRKAKQIILFTFIGLLIVLSGKGIISLIRQIIEGGPPSSPSTPPPTPPPSQLTSVVLASLGDIYPPGGDCAIDISDTVSIAGILGAQPGDPNWDPNKDLSGHDGIDMCDLYIVGKSYGLVCD